jgi:hypothetical protein
MHPITLFVSLIGRCIGAHFIVEENLATGVPFVVPAPIILFSLKTANADKRFVGLRAGKLQSLSGPGRFVIIAIWDQATEVIDERVQTTTFTAEQALSRDSEPVNAWRSARCASPTGPRCWVRSFPTGRRPKLSCAMPSAAGSPIEGSGCCWSTSAPLPFRQALQNAMSRQARAARAKEARVNKGAAEAEIAAKFVEAALSSAKNPPAR